MAYTPEQIAKIRQKEATLPDAHKRDSLKNYLEGYFFVTLNTRTESPILSIVEGQIGATGDDASRCRYTKLGNEVLACWQRNSTIYSGIEVIACEAMPDHFHGLLYLKPGNKQHLGIIIRGFMIGCTHAYWDVLGIDWRSQTYTKGVRTPEYNDSDHTRSYRGPALFTRGYNDVIPITPEEVQTKIDYIHTQAERYLIKQQGHDRFRIHRNQISKNWNASVAHRAILNDRFFSNNEMAATETWGKISARLHQSLDYLGNGRLLASEKKLPLICHRADASRFEAQREAVINAARNGYVIVSAFISPREREIREQLMLEFLPFVEIMDNGFPDRYKPTGKAFYACAENRLVQISCWSYLYQRDTAITRAQCLVMNELARVICKRDEYWWVAH